MKGRIWLILGVGAGIAIGVGGVPYFAGAASSLSDTAQRIVGSGGLTLVHSVARRGASRRVVQGITSLLRLLVPGVTAFLLILAARLTMRLRMLVGALVLVLGVVSFFYIGHGAATGALLLAAAAAVVVVFATGPLVAAPLAALAALIGTEFLPRLVRDHASVPHAAVVGLHRALFATAGSPLWLEILVLALAALPFLIAARLVIR